MNDKKQLEVSAIKDGIVIDHIPARNLFKVIEILGLNQIETQITFGTNLNSKKLGKKGIIKISDVFFEDEDINKIALLARKASLCIIKNYKVVEKKEVEIPDTIKGIVRCVNPKCITNVENVKTRYTVESKNGVKLRCHYCEKITDQDHIKIL